MSELQLDDDPDPEPLTLSEYDTDFGALDERESIANLSNYASSILESDKGVGSPTDRQITTRHGELSRSVTDGAWAFRFIDTLEGGRRCRSWRLGSSAVSWCSSEKRHEPAADVLARLEVVFSEAEEATAAPSGKTRFAAKVLQLLKR